MTYLAWWPERRWCRGGRSSLTRIDHAQRGSRAVEDLEDGDRVGVRDQRALHEPGAEAAIDLLDLGSVAVALSGQRVVEVSFARVVVDDHPAGTVGHREERDPALAAEDGRLVGGMHGCRRPELRSRATAVQPLHRDSFIGSGR